MYAYLATGTKSISGTTEGTHKKTFILPAPTDKIVVSSGNAFTIDMKVALQTPSGNRTEHSATIYYGGGGDARSMSTMLSGLFPKGTKIIVTDNDTTLNAKYSTCTYNTLTFYKISPDFLEGGDKRYLIAVGSFTGATA